MLQALHHWIKPDWICLDLGANMGTYMLAMSALAPRGLVWAFEPDPVLYGNLCRTIEANDIRNAFLYQTVVGIDNIRGEFVEDTEWRSSSHFMPGGGPCAARSIDSYNLDRVDLIKIDIEGSELDALAGAAETIERCNPLVLMEFNSFAFIHYRNIVPREALQTIRRTYPEIRFFNRQRSQIELLVDDEAFLRNNLLTGFVDDLICTH